MKKKIFITLSFLLIGSAFINAQDRKLQLQTEQFIYTNDVYYVAPDFVETYDGSPYNSDTFLLGNVYINKELTRSDVAMRYNIYSDEMQIKESLQSEDKDITALIKSPDISVTILNETFIYLPKGKGLEKGGYFQVATTGKTYSLYKKLGKEYFEASKAKTSFERDVPAKFEDRTSYYIHFSNGGMVELPKSKKKRYKAFGESEALVKEYAKERKLDITKEKGLKRVIIYLDTNKSITQK